MPSETQPPTPTPHPEGGTHHREQLLHIPSHRQATGVITKLLSNNTADIGSLVTPRSAASLASILPNVCSHSEVHAGG